MIQSSHGVGQPVRDKGHLESECSTYIFGPFPCSMAQHKKVLGVIYPSIACLSATAVSGAAALGLKELTT